MSKIREFFHSFTVMYWWQSLIIITLYALMFGAVAAALVALFGPLFR